MGFLSRDDGSLSKGKISGFLLALGGLITTISQFMSGTADANALWASLTVFLTGLGIYGVRAAVK